MPRPLLCTCSFYTGDIGLDALDDDLLGTGPVEETTIQLPDGQVVVVKYRGVDTALVPGSAEWKKAKRLVRDAASE